MLDCRSRSACPAASHPPTVAGTHAATPGKEDFGEDLGTWGDLGESWVDLANS